MIAGNASNDRLGRQRGGSLAADAIMLLFRDVAPLIVLSSLLLLMTLLMGPGNVADVRVQLIWFVFLLNGWFWSPVWQRSTSSVLTRFSAAMITSLASFKTGYTGGRSAARCRRLFRAD